MNVKKLEKKIISKDRIFFVVLFVVTAITLGFLSAVETVTVSDFKNDISPDLAIFNNNLGSIDPTKLQTQKNSLSNIWLNEEVFLYLEFTHLDLYLNDSNLISEEMVGLFSSNTTGLINYLIESQVAFIEGNIPVGEDEVLVDRDTYYKLLYQNNKSDLLNSPFPLNFHFGVAQKKNITLEIKITGIIEFDLNSPIIKSLFGYYYSYPIDINLRSSVEFALNRFSNYFILGNFEMGESLFTEFHNLDIYHYILTRFCVYDNKFHSNINSAIENQSIEKTLSYLNQENGEFWALSGGSLDIFLTKSSLINDWFILILFAGFIFVMFLMIFYKFYYDKSLRENYSRELDSLINIGLPVKKIMILYLYDRIKRLNASILFSFATSLLFKFLFVIFFNLPSVLSVYYINFQIFIIIFIIYNAIFIPIEYFRVKKGINTILPKKNIYINLIKQLEMEETEAVRNGRNRSHFKISLIILLYLILLFPLFVPRELLLQNGRISDFIPQIDFFFPYTWIAILGFYPFVLYVSYFFIPFIALYSFYPLIVKILDKINEGKTRFQKYFNKTVNSSHEFRKPFIFITIFSLVIITSLLNTTSLNLSYDSRVQKARFGPDLICYERIYENHTQNFEFSGFSTLSDFEGVTDVSKIENSFFRFGGTPLNSLNLKPANFYKVIDPGDVFFEDVANISGNYNSVDGIMDVFYEFDSNPEYVIISNKFALRYGIGAGERITIHFREAMDDGTQISKNGSFCVIAIASFIPGIDFEGGINIIFHEFAEINTGGGIFTEEFNNRYYLRLDEGYCAREVSSVLKKEHIFEFPVIEEFKYSQSTAMFPLLIISRIMIVFFLLFIVTLVFLFHTEVSNQKTKFVFYENIGFSQKKALKMKILNLVKEFVVIMLITNIISIIMAFLAFKIQNIIILFDISYINPFVPEFGSFKAGDGLLINGILPYTFTLTKEFFIMNFGIAVIMFSYFVILYKFNSGLHTGKWGVINETNKKRKINA